MASYHQALGMWRANGLPGYYPTKEEAEAAEQAGASENLSSPDELAYVEDEVSDGVYTRSGVAFGDVRLPGKGSATAKQATQSNELFSRGYTDLDGDGRIDDRDVQLSTTAYGTPQERGGTASSFTVAQTPIGSWNSVRGRPLSYAGGVESLALNQRGTGPSAATEQRYADAEQETARAEDRFASTQRENEAENSAAWRNAWEALDNLEKTDYGMSDEARGWQREGLQQQRELLERMLGFDPNQYAAQFADQALARSVALGRSQGGGAAAQQAGVFAALEQAPALQAEGARMAASLENQRLQQAAGVAQNFGELGTMTRGQDEGRAQFESNLALSIANSVADLSQGQVQLNQQESQMFAEMWMDFARLQSVYAGMSSAEQIAWWQTEAQKRGQDKQFEAVMAQIRAGGAVNDKDILNGLFQLGGGLLTAGGMIGAAAVAGPAAAAAVPAVAAVA